MLIKIENIEIGERLREDYGDIKELAKSIKNYGLLHPIIVTPIDNEYKKYRLVAGGRRLMACINLGMTEIQVKLLSNLSERELRIIGLEENMKRKDLTQLEKSKNLIDLIGIKSGQIDSRESIPIELRADSAHNSIGRPRIVDSLRSLGNSIGVPAKTIHDAFNHVAAVEKYPELIDIPKYQAIKTAKILDKMLEDEKIIELQNIREQAHLEYSKRLDFAYEVYKELNKIIQLILKFDLSEERLDALLENFDATLTVGMQIDDLRFCINRLEKIILFLSRRR